MGAMKSLRALAFHAENLHEDYVWRRVRRVARGMARRGLKASFFVYPFRAQVANGDITDRVQILAALGHEIGQHTHFYAGAKIDKPKKVNDLSEANIIHCLHRDFETLQQIGFLPKGFTAGAWLVNGMVLDTLVELGFAYDCSARFPNARGMVNSPYHRWLRSPQLYANAQDRLLCLPTVCSLGEWFKWGRQVSADGSVPYQLTYLHDYDLLSLRNYLLLWVFLNFTRGQCFVSAEMLADRIREKEVR